MKIEPKVPRNPFVAAAKFRKAGAHKKSNKALRRQDKMQQPKIFDGESRDYLFSKNKKTLANPHCISRVQTKAITHFCLYS